jgi:predicted DNA-binding ribbon-helix-helix protein
MVHILHSDDVMTTSKTNVSSSVKSDLALRASVSFPPELYHILEQIASRKKVSLAWVVRDAAEKYVAEQWPLLNNNS